ncbi:hypothetical protein ILYODFUR_017311 [Ilyodon furcidens]|uniref:Uncharacterized protein n=1 Tax=Ilyodon furcidens TaxID=33524 RepID=A0ABV0UTX8_9TELE
MLLLGETEGRWREVGKMIFIKKPNHIVRDQRRVIVIICFMHNLISFDTIEIQFGINQWICRRVKEGPSDSISCSMLVLSICLNNDTVFAKPHTLRGLYGGAVVNTDASQQEDPGIK